MRQWTSCFETTSKATICFVYLYLFVCLNGSLSRSSIDSIFDNICVEWRCRTKRRCGRSSRSRSSRYTHTINSCLLPTISFSQRKLFMFCSAFIVRWCATAITLPGVFVVQDVFALGAVQKLKNDTQVCFFIFIFLFLFFYFFICEF